MGNDFPLIKLLHTTRCSYLYAHPLWSFVWYVKPTYRSFISTASVGIGLSRVLRHGCCMPSSSADEFVSVLCQVPTCLQPSVAGCVCVCVCEQAVCCPQLPLASPALQGLAVLPKVHVDVRCACAGVIQGALRSDQWNTAHGHPAFLRNVLNVLMLVFRFPVQAGQTCVCLGINVRWYL